jgi:hypothetical protein
MKFQFDSNQSHQFRAIEAFADIFRGQHVQPAAGITADIDLKIISDRLR